MKRPAPWEASVNVSSDDSSDSDSDSTSPSGRKSTANGGHQSVKDIMAEVPNTLKKRAAINIEALSRHGYRGGPSILNMPPPKMEEKEKNWSWSTGKEHRDANKGGIQESSEEHKQSIGAAVTQNKFSNSETKLQASSKDKALSFSQKEKRKRDLGQASRGKSYVEEEKRLLRENGVYSGFDT